MWNPDEIDLEVGNEIPAELQVVQVHQHQQKYQKRPDFANLILCMEIVNMELNVSIPINTMEICAWII